MFNGLCNLPPWGDILAAAVLIHVTVASVTLYLHRNQAHRAITLHPALAHFFRFWIWLTTATDTREWVAVHRKHHAHCETAQDPHSPQVRGLPRVLFGGVGLYRAAAREPGTLRRYGAGTPDDRIEHRLYRRHPFLGVLLMAAADVALFGLPGLAVWTVQMLWLPFWGAGVVNGVGHYFGYRNFECREAARNFSPIGVLLGGEELHNNHHAFPHSARFSQRGWEFDVGWMYIRVLAALHLLHVRRTAPVPRRSSTHRALDTDTVRAVLRYRMFILRDYGRRVIRPVFQREREHLDLPRPGRLRRLLLREPVLLEPAARSRLARALARNPRLRTVYAYRERLKRIWESPDGDTRERLRDWCSRAEATGIDALMTFARGLPTYVPTDAAAPGATT